MKAVIPVSQKIDQRRARFKIRHVAAMIMNGNTVGTGKRLCKVLQLLSIRIRYKQIKAAPCAFHANRSAETARCTGYKYTGFHINTSMKRILDLLSAARV
jgi:hypothetical protein